MKHDSFVARYLYGAGQPGAHASHLKSHRRNNLGKILSRNYDVLDADHTGYGTIIQEAGRGAVMADRGISAGRRFPDTPAIRRQKGELLEPELPKIDQQLNEYTTNPPPPKATDDIEALAKLAGN